MAQGSLTQLLRKLCLENGWNYAVLWKLKSQDDALSLACDEVLYPLPEVCGDVAGCLYSHNKSETDCHQHVMSGCHRCLIENPLDEIIKEMSCFIYPMTSGFLGQISEIHEHLWTFAENITGEAPDLDFMFSDQWRSQFASGIKTIALVPIMPHGLLQLGSFAIIIEDIELVSSIRSFFPSPSNFSKSTAGIKSESHLGSPLSNITSMPSFMSYKPSAYTRIDRHKARSVIKSEPPDVEPSIMPMSFVEDEASVSNCMSNEFSFNIATRSAGTSNPLDTKIMDDNSQMLRIVDLAVPPMSEELQSHVCNFLNLNCLDEASVISNAESQDLKPNFISNASDEYHPGSKSANNLHYLPDICEPDQLGSWLTAGDSSLAAELKMRQALEQDSIADYPLQWYGTDGLRKMDPLFSQTSLPDDIQTLLLADESQNLLDILLDEDPIYRTLEITTLGLSFQHEDRGHPSTSTAAYDLVGLPVKLASGEPSSCILDHHAPAEASSSGWSTLNYGSVSGRENSSISTISGTSTVTLGSLLDDRKRKDQPVMLASGLKVPKRRAKPGESGKARPRDRQLIQDRIKELRELVPNGAKCSIDALFERTIKHMQFLTGVAGHVDKLKQCAQALVQVNEDQDARNQVGTSWACEVDSNSDSHPLIVKNLNHPGRMLVEMLCEEQLLFLEIAQVIRSLGLTILKGAMETREDGIWAHFIIEVTRAFQRMDLLWPLMKLLQPKINLP